MSKGSRKKRAARPWQNPEAFRELGDLLSPSYAGDELELEGYEVRRVDASNAVKEYVCPECGNPVPVGEGHVVVWPEGDADLRRHWHRHCWRIEVRRSRGAGDEDDE
jgi:hypothetical protein